MNVQFSNRNDTLEKSRQIKSRVLTLEYIRRNWLWLLLRTPLRVLWVGSSILRDIKGDSNILNAGCGPSDFLVSLNEISKPRRVIGLDIFLPYLKDCISSGCYEHVIRAVVQYLPFRTKSIHSSLLLHVIEHLNKEEGLKALKELERVSSKVVVVTPCGFWSQNSFDDNPYQQHLSGWTRREMEQLGYKVRGLYGLRYLWMKHASLVFPNWSRLLITSLGAILTTPFVYMHPDLALNLYCVKKTKAKTRL